ncbi:MAG TPA: hypothetical protein VES97_02275 [Solirubrobacteraceae bacterium]|nr:hypothetical protein [Solirubrobacteraceae bacterium]
MKHGPEFANSKRACDVPPDRLTLHLNAAELNLERDPLRYSEAFADEARRVIETRDEVGKGFIFTAYVVLYEDFTAELKWIETRPLPEEEEEV